MIYIFILSPSYSGSTILYKLLNTSPNITTLLSNSNPSHVGEGCALFHMTHKYKIENYLEIRNKPHIKLPMKLVKEAYESIWDKNKSIFCDKSIPTLYRAKEYNDYFQQYGKVYFISLIRNPYFTRHNIKDWYQDANYVKHNIEHFDNLLHITYEELTDNILDSSKNMEYTNDEKTENKLDNDIEVDLTEFSKIIIDFLFDLTNTFPEIKNNLNNNLKIILDHKNKSKDDFNGALKEIYLYCQNFYPERFFDILYQNNSIFDDLDKDNNFLPDLQFSNLFKLDISNQTKKTIWKYIQLILFSVVTNVKNDNCFGETAKLFEAIGQDEFKNKITETMEEMQKVFQNNNSEGVNLPDPNQIHDHISGLMDGKLGKLAKEIADDTAAELDIDPTNIKDVGDVFQKLFKDPSKLMGIVKNVGSKLDQKMKSGELKESELIQEATEMMGKMQNLPGMDKMGDIFNKLNIPNLGGNAKFNKGAFDQMMQNNFKKAKTKERMKAKLDANKQTDNSSKNNNQSELDKVNENLINLMKELNLDNISDIMNQINKQDKNNTNSSEKPKKKKAKSGNKK